MRDNDWWLPVKEIPHNLPHLATAFVGREREIGEVGPRSRRPGW